MVLLMLAHQQIPPAFSTCSLLNPPIVFSCNITHTLQEKWYVPSGLWAQHRSVIAAKAQAAGLNCIRLVWSTEMAIRSANGSVQVPAAALYANPDLQGKGPLQVLDAVIAVITQQVGCEGPADWCGCSALLASSAVFV
jgi:hypothetical protein